MSDNEDNRKQKSISSGAGAAIAVGTLAVVGLAAYGVYSIFKKVTDKRAP